MSSMGDIAIRQANIITMNPLQPRAEALAVREGRIAAVGAWEHAAPYAEGVPVLDLAGKTGLRTSAWFANGCGLNYLLVSLLLLFAAWSIRCAYRHYLRMPHSAAIAGATQIVAVLAAVTVVLGACVAWSGNHSTRMYYYLCDVLCLIR